MSSKKSHAQFGLLSLVVAILSHNTWAIQKSDLVEQAKGRSHEWLVEDVRSPWPNQGAVLVESWMPFSSQQNPWQIPLHDTLNLRSLDEGQSLHPWVQSLDGYLQAQRVQFRASSPLKNLRWEFSGAWSRVSWSVDDHLWGRQTPGADFQQAHLGLGLGSPRKDRAVRVGGSYALGLWQPWFATRYERLAGGVQGGFERLPGAKYGDFGWENMNWVGRFEGSRWGRNRQDLWEVQGIVLPTLEAAGTFDSLSYLSAEYDLPGQTRGHLYTKGYWFPGKQAWGGSLLLAGDPSRLVSFEMGVIGDASGSWNPLFDFNLAVLNFHASRAEGWRGLESKAWTWGLSFQIQILDDGSLIRPPSRQPRPPEVEVKK